MPVSQIEHFTEGRALPVSSLDTSTRYSPDPGSRPMTPRSNALVEGVQSARPSGPPGAAVRGPHDVRCPETERHVGDAQSKSQTAHRRS